MNRFMDALWELKLRVDAHDEQDEKANRAFETLKRFIENTEAQTERVNSVEETDKDPDVCLTHLEAERRLFGMDVFAQGSLYADWFPLPFWMSQADTF